MNWKITALIIVLLLGVMHEALPDYPNGGALYHFFPFSAQQLTPQTYAYFLFESIGRVILAYIIVHEETRFKHVVKAFFWIQVADCADYLLTYNTTWVNISGGPISMNTLGIVIFVAIVWRHGRINID